jgi:hypothetical protein
MLSHGTRFLGQQAGLAVALDVWWIMLFALYLLNGRRRADVTAGATPGRA